MKPFLLRVERDENGKLIGTIHSSAIKDALAVFVFPDATASQSSSGMTATLPPMSVRETAYAPRLDGDALVVQSMQEEHMVKLEEALIQANRTIKAQIERLAVLEARP